MAKVRVDSTCFNLNVRILYSAHPFDLQHWPSVSETQSRSSFVGLRRQKSFTCSQCRAPSPACTGWRSWMRAGEERLKGSPCFNQTDRNHIKLSFSTFQLPQLFLQLRGWIQTFSPKNPNPSKKVKPWRRALLQISSTGNLHAVIVFPPQLQHNFKDLQVRHHSWWIFGSVWIFPEYSSLCHSEEKSDEILNLLGDAR